MSQAPPQPAPAQKLNLRRLESLQRLLQYGAALVLLVFFALIVLAWFQLRGLNAQIAERKGVRDALEKEVGENEKEIERQRQELGAVKRLNNVLTDVSRAYTEQNPAEAQKVRDAVEQSIGQSVEQGAGQKASAAQVPPRIYIQITRADQRARAGEVARRL